MVEPKVQLLTCIDDVFAEQKRYSIELREGDYGARLAVLERFENVFKSSYEELYAAAFADFSKPASEVDVTEILPIVSELKLVKKNLKRWMRAERVLPTPMLFGTSSEIVTEPRGVCLIVSPWNYPFNLTFCPMILALAAGNTVILKPSEVTPFMSAVIVNIVNSVFEKKEVAIFEGDETIAGYLTSLPFDHIFFTGSPNIGKKVMASAAKNLASVTLELGGKSPVIVDDTVHLKSAAEKIVFGKFCNNGQTCIAPDHLYVKNSIYDDLVSLLSDCIKRQYGPLDKLHENPDYCQIVNDAHFRRLEHLLDDALQHGAEVLVGGRACSQKRFMQPTLLTNLSCGCDLMNEEIFGPILPIIRYDSIESVLQELCERPKPLALYIFSSDRDFQNKVVRRTSAGDTCINQIAIHFLHEKLPFGGVNQSGLGKTGGKWGFDTFSHKRSVLKDKFTPFAFLTPPYKQSMRGAIRGLIRHFF